MRDTLSLIRPCMRVPTRAPMIAPGTAHTIKFHGIAPTPPSLKSSIRCVAAAPITVPATITVEVAAATGTGKLDRLTRGIDPAACSLDPPMLTLRAWRVDVLGLRND